MTDMLITKIQPGNELSTLDAIIKNTGPDVQATLILSRKDGSIIRAHGFPEANTTGATRGHTYDWNQSNESHASIQQTTTDDVQSGDDADQIGEHMTPSQVLAASIFDFVNYSEKLASSISQATSRTGLVSNTGTQSTEQQTDQTDAADEEDVQLLRMRTKRQEVIIIPHPNYLMCVIQNLPKASSRHGPT